MAKEEITELKVRSRLQAHGGIWASGDGAKTEFDLSRTISNAQQLLVAVGGAIKRPADSTGAHDYKIRGLSTGYDGTANKIKFAAPPGAGVDVLTQVIG